VDISELGEFKDEILNNGCDPTTADLYAYHVKKAHEANSKDLTARLRDPNLSPLTKRSIKAALVAWAKFREDVELEKRIKKIKLPAAVRKSVKMPLTRPEWESLLEVIDAGDYSPAIIVIALMARRGFRIGDLLRMRRADVEAAVGKLKTISFVAKGNRILQFGVTKNIEPLFRKLLDQDWETVGQLISPNDDPAKSTRAAKMAVRRALAKCAEAAGIDSNVNPHRLRRTVAVYFLEKAGGDLLKLKDWMQWVSLNVAAGYVDYQERKVLDAIGESIFDE